MASRFTDKAVDALADYLYANYATYLRLVETECSLAENALPNPVAYVRADLPHDNRTPRMDIYEEGWVVNEDDTDDILADVTCSVVWTYLGDANQEAGELLARRCLTALIKCIWASRTLGGEVRATYFGAGSAAAVTEESGTRHGFIQPVIVSLQEVM